jgi:hypothetical protein
LIAADISQLPYSFPGDIKIFSDTVQSFSIGRVVAPTVENHLVFGFSSKPEIIRDHRMELH